MKMTDTCPACEHSTSFRKNPERENPNLSEAQKKRLPPYICNGCGAAVSGFLKK